MIYIDSSLPWLGSSAAVSAAFPAEPAFRYNKSIRDGLIACGLTPVPCSGETDWTINPSTLTYSSMSSTVRFRITYIGFYVVKLFSTTRPTLYLRVDWGFQELSQVSVKVVPFYKFTFGTACDSAGVLSGIQASSGFQSSPNTLQEVGYTDNAATLNTGLRPLYISSDGENYLTLSIDPAFLGYNTGYSKVSYGTPGWFALERSIDPATGAYDGDGFFFVTCSVEKAASIGSFGYIDLQTQSITTSTTVPVQTPGLWNNSVGGGSNIIMPITCCSPKIKAPMRACVFYFRSEIQTSRRFNVTMNGENVTFMAQGNNVNGQSSSGNSGISANQSTVVTLALRFQ